MSRPDLRSECWSILKLTPPRYWSSMVLSDTDNTFMKFPFRSSPDRNLDLAPSQSSILPINLLSKPFYVVFNLKLSLSRITFPSVKVSSFFTVLHRHRNHYPIIDLDPPFQSGPHRVINSRLLGANASSTKIKAGHTSEKSKLSSFFLVLHSCNNYKQIFCIEYSRDRYMIM